ncbi:hypothetical protein CDAR_107161 [Caerostris darwini]|uniref:Uncharacterized protein n=1 Tax=Caerostris darwini TaxID=1538125 RepID=A0AAV4SVY2_9ARAC|nr:hypothetical protein CDAR_107161 [Caerostris darwini]
METDQLPSPKIKQSMVQHYHYCNIPECLRAVVKAERCSIMLSSAVILLHDNVWPLMVTCTLSKLARF